MAGPTGPMLPLEDIQIETFPPSVKGGQHVGVSYGVKITHMPTGLIAIANTERSQLKNREIAMDMLLAGLTHPRMGGA